MLRPLLSSLRSNFRSTLLPIFAIFTLGPITLFGGPAVTANVTGLTIETVNGNASTDSISGGGSSGFSANTTFTINYGGINDQIRGYQAGTSNYVPLAYPGDIATTLVRVPGIYANNNNIIYSRVNTQTGNTWNLFAPYLGDQALMFNSNNINAGTDNLFGNIGDGNSNNNNIERLDVVFRQGVVATPSLAFAIFERGVTNGHDPIGIAAITAIDSNGKPTAYGSLIRFGAGSAYGSYGTSDLIPNTTDWLVFRNLPSDPGALARNPSASVTNQAIGGVTVAVVGNTSDHALGIAPNTTIYGYSLFGGDVTGTGGQILTDASTFPLNTSASTGAGGIDLIAYTGVLFKDVTPSIPGHFSTDEDFLDFLADHCVTLPANEVFVAQVRGGNNATNGDYEVGLHVPPDFTNVGPVAGNSQFNWGTNAGSNPWVPFTLSRNGTTITFTMGNYSGNWTAADIAELNAIGLRARSDANATTAIRNIIVDGLPVAGSDLLASGPTVALTVISDLNGNFTVTGEASLNWTTPSIPGGSRLGFQIKGLKGFDSCNSSIIPTPPPALTAAMELTKTGVFFPAQPTAPTISNVFGLSHEFNALIFGNLRAENGDTDARLAVGGNASLLGGYAVGYVVKGHPLAQTTGGVLDRLIVAGDLVDGNFGVNGNIVVGGTRTGPDRELTFGNLLRSVNPVTFDSNGNVPADGSGTTFAELRTAITATSAALGSMPDQGVVAKNLSLPYRADLVGNSTTLNVFNVTTAGWNRTGSSINITAPSGSVVLINIHGPSAEISNSGMELNGVDLERVLFNYVDATNLKTTNFAHLGSVLAPHASADFNAGSIDGRAVLGGDVTTINGFEFHNFHFNGTVVIPNPNTRPRIEYTFTVKNTGGVPLENVTVTDPLVPVIGGPIDLAIGATDSTTFTAIYYPTAAEIASGSLTNTAAASAETAGGAAQVSDSDTHVLTFPVLPGLLDSDADGISDMLEGQYFGQLNISNATSDWDEDGISDADEILAGSDPAATESEPILNGIVSWWNFDDDTTLNTIAGAPDGIPSGSPQFIDGARGRAIKLNGTTDSVSLQSLPTFIPVVTVSAVVRFDDLPVTPATVPLVDAWSATENFRLLAVKSGSQPWKFSAVFRDRLNETQVYAPVTATSQSVPVTDTFIHVALTYDGTKLTLYVNGSKEAEATTNKSTTSYIPTPLAGPAIHLGKNADGTAWLDGAVDEVRLYNRALGENEVLSLYSAIPWRQFGIEWATAQGGNSNRYEVIIPLLAQTASEALNAAIDRGGYLVAIDSAPENAFVAAQAVDQLVPAAHPLIGAYRPKETGIWKWPTDDLFTFQNWQPGGDFSVPLSSDASAWLFNHLGNGSHGLWFSTADTVTVPSYVVEYELLPPAPVPTPPASPNPVPAPNPLPLPLPVPVPVPVPAPVLTPTQQQIQALENRIVDVRTRIRNPSARASQIRRLNLQIRRLKQLEARQLAAG